jgi:hypothetical protein
MAADVAAARMIDGADEEKEFLSDLKDIASYEKQKIGEKDGICHPFFMHRSLTGNLVKHNKNQQSR